MRYAIRSDRQVQTYGLPLGQNTPLQTLSRGWYLATASPFPGFAVSDISLFVSDDPNFTPYGTATTDERAFFNGFQVAYGQEKLVFIARTGLYYGRPTFVGGWLVLQQVDVFEEGKCDARY